MKTIAHIHGLFKQEVGEQLFLELARVYPEGCCGSNGHSFIMDLPTDDPRLIQSLDLLRREGLKEWNPDVPQSEWHGGRYYKLQLERVYDRKDLDRFSIFEVRLPSSAYHLQVRRGAHGRLVIPLPTVPDDLDINAWDFMCGDGGPDRYYFIPEKVRNVLSRVGLKHLSLVPADLLVLDRPSDIQPANEETAFWEINGDFILPPVSPGTDLVDRHRRQVWPGAATGLFRREGLERWPELHYRASDMRAIEPFDIARTFENFGSAGGLRVPDRSPLIVSKRFYDVCQQHGFKVDWLPVHIDPI